MRAGDTLVCLTGRAAPEDLAAMMRLRGTYAAIMIGLLGPQSTPVSDAGFTYSARATPPTSCGMWDEVWT